MIQFVPNFIARWFRSIARFFRDERSQWFWWYLGALSFSVAGTKLAYSELLSSAAWRCWSGPGAWKRDSMLAFVAALLAMFLLWNMQAFSAEQKGRKSRFIPSHLYGYEWVLLAAAVFFLLIYNFRIVPNKFREELPARMSSLSNTFYVAGDSFSGSLHAGVLSLSQEPSECRDLESKIGIDYYHQIIRPYYVYIFYSIGFWVAIVMPIFLFLVRCVSADWGQWKERRRSLGECVSKACDVKDWGVQDRTEVFERLLLSLQDYVVGLKGVAEQYVPVLLGVSLLLLYYQMTPSSQTVTDLSVEYGKFAVWLLLGPALLTCIIIVALGYQNAAHKAESGLRALVGSSTNFAADSELLKRIAETRSKLVWDQSPAAFILSVAKSATVSIPLLLAVIAYVLHLHSEGWFRIFVPQALVDFVQNLYK
jgi:hypothetical protein